MSTHSRRGFVKAAAAAAAAGGLPALGAAHALAAPVGGGGPPPAFDLGIASYTFREFPLDQAIAMTLKDMHLPMSVTADEMKSVQGRLAAAGIQLSSCGVVYMTTEDEVRKAFAYARLAGIRMMVGVPEAPLLELAERMVRETDISLAIHNHGPTDKRFPSPESAYRPIAKMDRRMGLCIDIGHTQRLGLDPAAECERFFDRLFDVHIKDVSSADARGTTVEIGSGIVDTPKLIRTLARLKYTGTLHFEHEKDQQDPFPGVAESVGYVRGVMATL